MVKRGRQEYAKEQPVLVELASCPLRLTYQANVRRTGPGVQVTHEVWLVEVCVIWATIPHITWNGKFQFLRAWEFLPSR
jgi:hypothetical protein